MTEQHKQTGSFITLEGGEGVGKSTNLAFIIDDLKNRGLSVVKTREPGGTPIAEQVRDLLLHHADEALDPTAELLLVFAARAQHLAQVIKPSLYAGKVVVSDRFTDASFAYQGAGRGLSITVLETLEKLVQQALQPDLTLLLDLPVADGMARVAKRGQSDRFEQQQHDFFERVRAGYLARARAFPDRFRIIDAAQPLVDVQQQIRQVLDEFFSK
ncbi:dTMP kinase [Zooshikella ganghwensis]|uniref:Thymidylate kinase n=1 Tax=Zooshikella ganghwensis TaxID=202772 RepID=A0A4P9VST6_9GAMM|nr:dTMP kinase [Zooshikella ganghwensis]RDH46738.1 dTMP kinase [Zooshikella ganghwensis]